MVVYKIEGWSRMGFWSSDNRLFATEKVAEKEAKKLVESGELRQKENSPKIVAVEILS